MTRSSILALALTLLTLSACGESAENQLARGEQLYQICKGCHDMRENKSGPYHCWLVGRPAATAVGYSYSQVVKDSGLTWDEKTLDAFLKAPLSFLPGTKMGFAGYHLEGERTALIAYLKKTTSDPQSCEGIPRP